MGTGVGPLGVWQFYRFSVTTNTTGAHNTAYRLQLYLNSLSPTISPAISVPPDLRNIPGVYTLEFLLCNTAGQCDKDYTELTIYGGLLPFADIKGRRTTVMYRNKALLLESHPQAMKTSHNTTAAGGEIFELQYKWRIKNLGANTWMDV